MPHMMMASAHAGAPVFLALHALFCIVTFIGVILFLVWAYKFLKEPRLRELVVIFLSVGLVGLFLSTALGGMMMKKGYKSDNVMKIHMMDNAPEAMFEIRRNMMVPGESI